MWGFLRGLLWGVALIAAGWFVGSIYPAPESWSAPLKRRTNEIVASLDLSPEALARLRERLTAEEYDKLSNDAARLASESGAAILVEHDGAPLEEHLDNLAMDASDAAAAPTSGGGVEEVLKLCPRMTVSNAPAADAERSVLNYHKRVNVNGVSIAVAPTQGACLSSSFGARNGRQHKGVDLHAAEGGPVFAGGAGTVVERKYRDDYGNMLLIDHGGGVYTRYAHLSSFASGILVGSQVTQGQQIGLMGNTASYRIPIHLHYELLLGDYNTPRQSFGLTARSPFEFPAAG